MLLALFDRLAQHVQQQGAVGQSGQAVMGEHALGFAFGMLAAFVGADHLNAEGQILRHLFQ